MCRFNLSNWNRIEGFMLMDDSIWAVYLKGIYSFVPVNVTASKSYEAIKIGSGRLASTSVA